MNIETPTVEFIRTGRFAADAILHDEALTARLPDDMLSCLKKLRDRTCLPRDAIHVMVPIQQAIEDERVSVQRQLDAMRDISLTREEAARRLVSLRLMKEGCALFEAATHDFLDALAGEQLQYESRQNV